MKGNNCLENRSKSQLHKSAESQYRGVKSMPSPLHPPLICFALMAPLSAMAGVEVAEVTDEKKSISPSTIVVSATKTPRQIDNVPGEVTVLNQELIDDLGAKDINDIFKNEIDISVSKMSKRYAIGGSGTGRAGNESINIRGLEGNQVLIVQDGIRIPNTFGFGPFSTGRSDYLALDGVSSIEVLRGPASTLYGSDGLAGVVNVKTLTPSDILNQSHLKDSATQEAERTFGAFVKGTSGSSDHSSGITVAVASKNDHFESLILASNHLGHEMDNQGGNDEANTSRTSPNPLFQRGQYLLGKVGIKANSSNSFGLTVETHKLSQDSEVLSARGLTNYSSRGRNIAIDVTGLSTHDEIQRNRISIKHQYSDISQSRVQGVETQIYWQAASTEQNSFEERTVNLMNNPRSRSNQYQQNVLGLSTQAETYLEAWADHRITYGLDLSASKITGVRDGTSPTYPEVFPAKPFPDTDYRLMGGFIQDEMEFGKFSVIPSIRFDQYRLLPNQNAYQFDAKENSGSAFTKRLGLIWRADELIAPYAQYSEGYRAPTPEQVNNGFENRQHGYVSVSNADLKPEKAKSIELGIRGTYDGLKYSGSVYDNRYDDFISQEKISGMGSPRNPSVYQYVNLNKAHIQGWDLRADWRLNHHWRVIGGIAQSFGKSSNDIQAGSLDKPLNSIQPLRISLGLRYEEALWGAQLNWRYAQKKDQDDVSEVRINALQNAAQFIPPSAQVFDLGVQYRPQKNWTLRANLNNVFNTTYWDWSDVRGITADSKVLDAYTAPGRSANVSIRYDY